MPHCTRWRVELEGDRRPTGSCRKTRGSSWSKMKRSWVRESGQGAASHVRLSGLVQRQWMRWPYPDPRKRKALRRKRYLHDLPTALFTKGKTANAQETRDVGRMTAVGVKRGVGQSRPIASHRPDRARGRLSLFLSLAATTARAGRSLRSCASAGLAGQVSTPIDDPKPVTLENKINRDERKE